MTARLGYTTILLLGLILTARHIGAETQSTGCKLRLVLRTLEDTVAKGYCFMAIF